MNRFIIPAAVVMGFAAGYLCSEYRNKQVILDMECDLKRIGWYSGVLEDELNNLRQQPDTDNRMDKTIRQELSTAIFKAIEITMLRWDEVQADENCAQAAEVLQMLHASLEEEE